ncbi:MAG: sugar phosphate isomerase/epimerase [Actinobacteria bacterium]|nr:sugar phosphate isomerase/epimerase [Actinomycetota bacterium]
MNPIAFMSANYVARQTGYAMDGWGHGDRTTNDHFRPLETFAERFGELLASIRALGFDTIDVWGAHLNPAWATDEHVAIAREGLALHGLRVSSYAAGVGPSEVERAADIALALGTTIIGAGAWGETAALVPALRERGVRLAIENHPERTPHELLARIEAGDGTLGTTVDTGWWATQGYDPVRAIEELGEHVLHVHLKDVRAPGEPHETCPWGDGCVPVEGCVRALGRLGYTGALTIEHEPEHHDPSGECRAMLTVLRGWLA